MAMTTKGSSGSIDRLFAAQRTAGPSPRRDVVQFACQVLGKVPVQEDECIRLAFFVLSLHPQSAVSAEMSRAASATHARYKPLLERFVDSDDLIARVRERAWRVPDAKLASMVQNTSLRALVWRLASWAARDELRALSRGPRAAFDEDAAERVVHEGLDPDRVIDVRDMLARLSDEVPDWARDTVLAALLQEIDPDAALKAINEKRPTLGMPEWTPTGLRVWLHRVRARLREKADT